jgi:hypothetical protein
MFRWAWSVSGGSFGVAESPRLPLSLQPQWVGRTIFGRSSFIERERAAEQQDEPDKRSPAVVRMPPANSACRLSRC